jgi:hypothetical protein
MSSNQNPPPVHPVFQLTHDPPTSASPTPPSTEATESPSSDQVRSNRPRKLGLTASPAEYAGPFPVSPGSVSPRRASPRSEKNSKDSYFPQRSARARNTRTNSPSDNLSTPSCLSPGLSSGSVNSSRSPCSHTSSEYLTPPRMHIDTDKPPHKSRRPSDDSLTMMHRIIRRANTIPPGGKDLIPKRRNRRRKRKCRHVKVGMEEHQSHAYWWLPGCQVAPTAPVAEKELCLNHVGAHMPRKTRHGNTDTYGRVLSGMTRGRPVPPLLTRRWSSVEIGAHQVVLRTNLPAGLTTSEPRATPPAHDGQFTTKDLGVRHRSSTFTRGAIDHDIVRAVREKLTLRKVVDKQLETPASITLRRASPSVMSEASGGSTPLADHYGNILSRRPSAAYLITTKDIDSITELIEANLQRESQARISLQSSTRTGSSQSGWSHTPISNLSTKSPSVNGRGNVSSNGFVTGSRISVPEVQPIGSSSHSPMDYLQISTAGKKRNAISRADSQNSVHEVIWEGGRGSPQSASSLADEDDQRRVPFCVSSSESGTPRRLNSTEDEQTTRDKGNAFDPANARASINEWSWRCPQVDIAVVVTSDSDSPDTAFVPKPIKSPIPSRPFFPHTAYPPLISRERTSPKPKPFPRAAISDDKQKDVISFPALPRKRTNDWYQPLPEMQTSPLPTISKSLYDLGIDANAGDSGSRTVTPKASTISWVRSAELTRNPSVEFDPGYGVRRKSVVKAPLKACLRTGEFSAMGSSIGSFQGQRSRSSAALLIKRKRISTIDNCHKGERDAPVSRWRPPSVCPPPKSPSPSEDEDALERPSAPFAPWQKLKSGIADRMAMIRGKTPQSPKVDHTGIYGKMTGSVRAVKGDPCLSNVNGEEERCAPHGCDDCAKDPRNLSMDWIG